MLKSWKMEAKVKNILPQQFEISGPLHSIPEKTINDILKILDDAQIQFLSSLFSNEEKAELFLDCWTRLNPSMVEQIVKGVSFSQKRRIERRSFMAVLCSMLNRKELTLH